MGENISVTDALALLGNRNGNGSAFGDEGVLLLFIILLFGGWGGRGFGGNQGGGYGAGGIGGNELYPWLNQSEQINDGFRDQMLNNGIVGIQQSVTNGFSGVQQSLCSGFAGVNQGMSNGFNQTNVNMLQGFNGLQAQVAQVGCDNQLAMANQTAALLAEHCADRNALNEAVNTIVTNQTAGFQSIKDQLFQDKLDEKNDLIAQLRQDNYMKDLAASQLAQDNRIINGVYNRFSDCPVGTMPVYGNQPIFSCPQRTCGCSGIAA